MSLQLVHHWFSGGRLCACDHMSCFVCILANCEPRFLGWVACQALQKDIRLLETMGQQLWPASYVLQGRSRQCPPGGSISKLLLQAGSSMGNLSGWPEPVQHSVSPLYIHGEFVDPPACYDAEIGDKEGVAAHWLSQLRHLCKTAQLASIWQGSNAAAGVTLLLFKGSLHVTVAPQKSDVTG